MSVTYNVLKSLILSGGGVESITITNAGSGYETVPTVTISGGGGSGATAVAVLGTGGSANTVVGITITDTGSSYETVPTVAFSGGGGIDAAGTAVLNDLVSRMNVATADGYLPVGQVTIQRVNGRVQYFQSATKTVVPS